MPRPKKGALDRDVAEDLWRHTLSQIPTLYGRISYLASLRDQNSGIYRHHGLAAMFGRDESSRALRQSHEHAFLEWLKLPMREKKLDLSRYFFSLDDPAPAVVEHMLSSHVYRTQTPDSARPMERKLYCADFEALLETIKAGWNADAPGPASSRPV
jgi:hypothetical protein